MVRTMVAAGAVALALATGAVATTGAGAAGAAGGGVSGAAGAAGVATAGPGGAAGLLPVVGAASGDGPAAPRTLLPPLDPPLVVARPFDAPAQRWAPGHRGADLSADAGQAVLAPAAGVVSFAGTVVDRGVVTVTHAGGLRSSLEPVHWSVRRGERVARGQVVGTVASVAGHCAPSTCLHWGLRRGETYLDPLRWVVEREPVVLLPPD